MGSDNLVTLHKWKNYKLLLNKYDFLVYKRRGYDGNPFPDRSNIRFLDFPFLDISATFIRDNIKNGVSMQYFLPEPVWTYINESNLYRQ
jgi:nicotinate-nucleotide adenylyltransferase